MPKNQQIAHPQYDTKYVSHTETFCETLVGYIRTGFPEWTSIISTIGGSKDYYKHKTTNQPGSCSQLIF